MACLGATEAEWKLLAMRSLRANQVGIAKNAFARLKDAKFLSLIENIEKAPNPSAASKQAAAAESGTRSFFVCDHLPSLTYR